MHITYLKLIKIFAIVFIIFFWYYNTHHYVDSANDCNIKIQTSFFEFNSKNIKSALTALKYGTPERYRKVCKNIHLIKPGMSCGGWQGGCYYGDIGEITISTANDQFLAWTSAVIAHEACHDSQKREHREISEEECYQVSHDTLVELVQYE